MYVATLNVWSELVTQDMIRQMSIKAAELNGDLAEELDKMRVVNRNNYMVSDDENASLELQGMQTTKRYWVSEDAANQWIEWIKANFESTLVSIEIV